MSTSFCNVFVFNDTATTEIYTYCHTLSLHDALPIFQVATQKALFMSAMIGIGSILACILVAMALVRRIARPIEALTAAMLKIAVGGPPTLTAVSGTRELRELGPALARARQRVVSGKEMAVRVDPGGARNIT